jgi:proteasome accessory factor C
MNQFHRFYKLHSLLKNYRFPISRVVLQRELEASKATVMRIIQELRNYGAPIEYSRERNGYFYDPNIAFELPGLWFSHSELFALITAYDLLTSAEPSLLHETLSPLKAKLDSLLKTEKLGSGELPKRVRIIRLGGRGPGACFSEVAQALIDRKQVQFYYAARTSSTEKPVNANRTVSPQRLTHYRDNWYLDAWCHERKDLRSFALERITHAHVSGASARNMPEQKLHNHFATSYGIFAGAPIAVAQLVFSAHRAQWIAEEMWHPAQKGEFLNDGRYQLDIPYSDSRELMMDILKNGPDVEVIAPLELRLEVENKLKQTLLHYTNA